MEKFIGNLLYFSNIFWSKIIVEKAIFRVRGPNSNVCMCGGFSTPSNSQTPAVCTIQLSFDIIHSETALGSTG